MQRPPARFEQVTFMRRNRLLPFVFGFWGALPSGSVLAAPGQTGSTGPQSESEPDSTDEPADTDAAEGGILPIRTYAGALEERDHLLGDMGGFRDRAVERGLRYELEWTQTWQGVVDGGRKRGDAYGGRLQLPITVDLDRAGLMRGALLGVRVEGRYGESVNLDTDALFAVNDAMFFPLGDGLDEDLLAITEVRYTQFLSETTGVVLGKWIVLGADANEFAGGVGTTQFMGHSFVAPAVTAQINPYSGLGASAFWMPEEGVTLSSALYTSSDTSTTSGFDLLDDGLTWSTALKLQTTERRQPGGMFMAFQYGFDGNYTDTEGQFQSTEGFSIPRTSTSWNAFWNGWQYLSSRCPESGAVVNPSDGRTDLVGYGVFARVGVADPETNPVDWSFSLGLGGRGLYESRPDDTWGIGFAHAQLRENLLTNTPFLDDQGQRWEAYYSFALTPAVELSFNFQHVDPLSEQADRATVLGLRLRCAF